MANIETQALKAKIKSILENIYIDDEVRTGDGICLYSAELNEKSKQEAIDDIYKLILKERRKLK